MDYMQILQLASIGLSAIQTREEEINEKTKAEYGHENIISIERLKRIDTMYDQLRTLILQEEKRTR